jgi:hypothetical protein
VTVSVRGSVISSFDTGSNVVNEGDRFATSFARSQFAFTAAAS